MSYSLIQIWDGTNKATVNTAGRLNLSVASSGITEYWKNVGLTVVELAGANANRLKLTVYNRGTSSVYYSSKSDMLAGATGKYISTIAAASNGSIDSYSGSIYGHVTGVSGDVVPVYVVDIG